MAGVSCPVFKTNEKAEKLKHVIDVLRVVLFFVVGGFFLIGILGFFGIILAILIACPILFIAAL